MKFLTALKHFFVPHAGNDYKPHLFREVALICIVAAAFFFLGLSFSSSFFMNKTVLGASIASSVLIDLTNESRVAFNQSPLVKSERLEHAATLKGEDMVAKGYFAHNSPEGTTPWYWLRKAGYTFLYAGENLAVNFSESVDVAQGWLDSPSHRANMLNAKFREIGIATVEGVYEGNPTIFVVQMFGTPAVPTVTTVTKAEKLNISSSSLEGLPAFVATTSEEQVLVASSTLAVGEVKGVGTEKPKEVESVTIVNNFIGAKTSDRVEAVPVSTGAPVVYSAWYERLLFSGSRYLDILYRSVAVVLAVLLFVMFFVEIKKQHWRHISYGLAAILFVVLCMYINTLLL